MRNIWIIGKREFNHFFISPIAYAVAFMILLIIGIIFYANIAAASLQQYGAPGVQIILGPMVTLFLFTVPAITMRTLAEENRSGTMELLLTSPVRDWELIIGKWFGCFLFALTILAVTLVYPIILNQLITPGIDQGILVSGYLGLILLAGAVLAVGVSASSMFSNQIAAFFASLGVLLILWMVGWPAQNSSGVASEVLRYLDISEHFYGNFYQGVIDLRDVIYFCSLITLSLFVGTISTQSRRWR